MNQDLQDAKTVCSKGHLLEGDNRKVTKAGHVYCAICNRNRASTFYHTKFPEPRPLGPVPGPKVTHAETRTNTRHADIEPCPYCDRSFLISRRRKKASENAGRTVLIKLPLICEQCGVEFIPAMTTQRLRFCSLQCGRRFHYLQKQGSKNGAPGRPVGCRS